MVKEKKSLGKFNMLAIAQIHPSSVQPRQLFKDDKINELSQSILAHGVLQPLIVRETKESSYEIVAGERRWRAAKLAGLKQIPCIIMNLIDENALAVALIENVQREDLNPIEEAVAYKRLRDTLKISQEEVAKRVGKDRASIANTLRLLQLPKDIQHMVVEQILSMGHARALLSLPKQDMMLMLAKKVVREGLSVRRCESIIRSLKLGANLLATKTPEDLKTKSPIEREVEQKLEYAMGTKVRLRTEGQGYAMVVYFSDTRQLNAILDRLNIEI